MSSMKWTAAQQSAIDARNQNLLLSASAGSGKTAVLTARIKELVTDMDAPMDITDLLVLTFTRAAASEMKARVSGNISKALDEARMNGNHQLVRHLSRQLSLMASAQISTLDSFFQTLIRQYFFLIDLDPETKLLTDENEKSLLQQEVLSDILEQYYGLGDETFLDCADLFSRGFQDDGLKSTILSIYQFSCSAPFPEDWIRRFPDPYHLEDVSTLQDIPWADSILKGFRMQAKGWADTYRRMFRLMEEDDALSPYGETLSEEYGAFSLLAEAQDWKDWYAYVSAFAFGKLKPLKRVQSKDPLYFDKLKTDIQTLRNGVKKEFLAQAVPFFAVPERQWIHDVSRMYPIVKCLSDLTIAFTDAYAARKKEEGLMEFTDMEHYALDILLDRNAPGFSTEHAEDFPSAAALALREKYKEVMIDEYQDTNGVQELITALISNGKNRFMVGDIKQSIYRFRQADSTIFMKKYLEFRQEERALDRRLDLNQNFRSDKTILSSINYIFRQLMEKETLELDYGNGESLYPGRHEEPHSENYIGGSVSLALITKDAKKPSDSNQSDITEEAEDLTGITLEGRWIAQKIHELLSSGKEVINEKGLCRRAEYDDIVILLRTIDKKAPALLKILNENNIPAVADRDDDYIQSTEVQILWALLKILDNPRQDLPLLAVLRSPFAGLDEEDFASLQLSKENPSDSFWDILPRCGGLLSEEKSMRLSRFLSLYQKWRNDSQKSGVAPLLRTILDDSDYLVWVSGLPNSTFRKAHIRSFYELARERDSVSVNGLFAFLEYLRNAQNEFKTVSPPAEGNAVRIMTIHKSKGLEFPIVFLADTAKSFNMRDINLTAILHKEMGLGIRYFDREHMVHWPSLYWLALKEQMIKESQAEEARLLYVAMTRARDKLFLTAFLNDAESKIASMLSPLSSIDAPAPKLPPHLVSKGKSYLSWLLPAASRHPSMKSLWDFIGQVPSQLEPEPGDFPANFTCDITPWTDLLTPEESRSGEVMSDEAVQRQDSQKENLPDDAERFLSSPAGPVPSWLPLQLLWEYGHPGAVTTPAKLTATAAVTLREAREAKEADEEPVPSEILAPDMENGDEHPLPSDYASPPAFLSEGQKFSGASYGTLMHKAMEIIDFTRLVPTESALRKEIETLYEKNQLTEEEKNALLRIPGLHSPIGDILKFMESPLGSAMKNAAVIRKEMPFSILFPAAHFYPGCEDGEKIFLQGVMDCLLESKDQLVIIDYKTDRIEDPESLKEHYKVQLLVYKEAAEQLLKKKVTGTYLWSFHLGRMVPIE